MTTDWCSLVTDGALSGNGCLESVLQTLQYRAKNCTGMELFCVCIFLLVIHAYACIVYRFYDRYAEAHLRNLQPRRPIQMVCTPRQVDKPTPLTVESFPPTVCTSTPLPTAEGLSQQEESDTEEEKPIWRPKLKKKRKKNPRQEW